MYAVSAAIGQVKWNWFRAQRRPLHHFELLDEASRGPLGSLSILLAGTVRSLATLGALVTLLNLAVAPFVQQVIDLSSEPSAPSPSADASFPIMTFPSFYFHTSEAYQDTTDASLSAIWNDASVYTRRAQCLTGNCTWPLVETLEWCVKSEKVADLKSDCPVLFEPEDGAYEYFKLEYEAHSGAYRYCNISLPGTLKPLTYTLSYDTDVNPYDRDVNPDMYIASSSIRTLAPVRVFDNKFEQETFMDIPSPFLSMAYAQFSIPSIMKGSFVLESLEQAVLTLCKKTYNVSMIQGNLSMESLTSDYGRFYQDETATQELGSNETWCWTPNNKDHLVSAGPSRVTNGNVTFLSDSSTMAFCTNTRWLLAQEIAVRLSGDDYIIYSAKRNSTGSIKGPAYSSVVPYFSGPPLYGVTSTSDILKRVGARSLSRVMESTAAALNQIYITKTTEAATGMTYTYETVVVVRWAWLALPIAVQALGLAFLLAVIATSNKAPLWKGSFLAALYHGFEHVPVGGDTATSSGMAEAAENTKALLTSSSKTKTVLLQY
ncbi:hypothetical protein PG985_002241 [Apiospora marii]|uniref:Uncharacterized protein n=1 Tax=Apiospora marii TaxID=335849 RepID=A0ABR1RZ09_9PEZI